MDEDTLPVFLRRRRSGRTVPAPDAGGVTTDFVPLPDGDAAPPRGANYRIAARQASEGRPDGFRPSINLDIGPAAAADARDSGHRPALARALLSKAHKSTPLRIWIDGSMADFPSVPDGNPRQKRLKPGGGRRGKVTTFSNASRRNLQRNLASMDRHVDAFTMMLTLPGECSHLSYGDTREAFKILMRRFAKERFDKVSGFWKRELQKRKTDLQSVGVVHFHLILFGLSEPGIRALVQSWFTTQWNQLVCVGLSGDETEHHRWLHAQPENMQPVGKNMSGYFAKYLGKDVEAADGELEGRWWGSFNKAALPKAPVSEVWLSPKAEILMHRLARKERQTRMDQGKARGIAAILSNKNAGPLAVSGWDLHRLRCGYDLKGFKNPWLAKRILRNHAEACEAAGIRPGKARFKGGNTFRIVLSGDNVSTFALQALHFVQRTLGESAFLLVHAENQSLKCPPTHRPRKKPSPMQAQFSPDLLTHLERPTRWISQMENDTPGGSL